VPLKEWKGSFLLSQIEEIAAEYGFDMDTPIGDIPEEALRVILHGQDEGSDQVKTRVVISCTPCERRDSLAC